MRKIEMDTKTAVSVLVEGIGQIFDMIDEKNDDEAISEILRYVESRALTYQRAIETLEPLILGEGDAR